MLAPRAQPCGVGSEPKTTLQEPVSIKHTRLTGSRSNRLLEKLLTASTAIMRGIFRIMATIATSQSPEVAAPRLEVELHEAVSFKWPKWKCLGIKDHAESKGRYSLYVAQCDRSTAKT